ncbi:uncharacterized protein LOC143850763 [Tasmannia lanceolata]|uniref:uncharacterized protein LOC143850763 n=1 Tax=Tasmannia lanceolata TaxID=3420 RepID=UPI0040638F61
MSSLKERRGFCLGGESNVGVVVEEEMRIVDILEESKDKIKKKGGRGVGCGGWDPLSSPRLVLSRLIASFRSSNTNRHTLISAASSRKRYGDKDEFHGISERNDTVVGSLAQIAPVNEAELDLEGQRKFQKGKCGNSPRATCIQKGELGNESILGSISGMKDEQSSTCSKSTQTDLSSGRYLEEASLNFGVGVGLVFLVVNSKNELSKMIELRTEMETLLKDMKNKMHRKDVISESSNTTNSLACSSSDWHGVETTKNHLSVKNHSSSDNLLQAQSAVECDRYFEFDSTSEIAKLIRIDEMEAELEAELERLQLSMDAENSELPHQQFMEMVAENSTPISFVPFCEEKDDPPEVGTGECYGVPPNELERRLHVLLQTRQQEQIEELESSLQYAERKLHEKEIEIRWWKDNVQLLLQHKQEVTCFSGKNQNT